LFQTLGFVTLVKSIIKKVFKNQENDNLVLWVFSLILFVFFTFQFFGKYQSLDAKAVNSYELARQYLKKKWTE
jgi:hypothetical protein